MIDKKVLTKLKRSPTVRAVASSKLTVICLFLLTVITIWGTIYQTNHGLYQAQQKFFYSWFFLVFGFIPLPGTTLILWILFINLICALVFRIGFRVSNIGNLLTHIGLIVLLIGGFFSFYLSEESFLSLSEGEGRNFSTAYHNWELAVWEEEGTKHTVYAVDVDNLRENDTIIFPDLSLELGINSYYKNCVPILEAGSGEGIDMINASGIRVLKQEKGSKKPSHNTAGIIFVIRNQSNVKKKVLLYGGELRSTGIDLGNKKYFFSLRKKRNPLPFFIKLEDFTIRRHPGSEIVRSYESRLTVEMNGLVREVLISMNRPFRYKDFSIFQSSYFIAEDGTEYSVFSVVKNSARLFPYIASVIVFLGLVVHFLMMLGRRLRRA